MMSYSTIFPVISLLIFTSIAITPSISKDVNPISRRGEFRTPDYHADPIINEVDTVNIYDNKKDVIGLKYVMKLLMNKKWLDKLPFDIVKPLSKLGYGNFDKILDLISSISQSEMFNDFWKYIESSGFIKESISLMFKIFENINILKMDFNNYESMIQNKVAYTNSDNIPSKDGINVEDIPEQNITHLNLKKTDQTFENTYQSGAWISIKSTIQRGLSFLDKEMALSDLKDIIPTHIIEGLLSFGDEVNVLNFLSQKLDSDFSEFIVQNIEPYLGSLRNMNNFYEFIQKNGFSYILDYIDPRSFSDINFSTIINEASKLSATLFDSTFSSEVLSKYMIFGDFSQISDILKTFQSKSGSSEDSFVSGILNIVTSLLTSPAYFKPNDESNDSADSSYADGGTYYNHMDNEIQGLDQSHENLKRSKRMSMLSPVTSKYGPEPSERARIEERQFSRDGGYGHSGGGYGGGGYDDGGHGHSGGYGHSGGGSGSGYGHGGGGYGGGGYGHGGGYGYMMQTLDPYVVLGSIALASLLGYLLFLLITTPGGGRRSLDGEFMSNLWLTDLPNPLAGWGSESSRGKRGLGDGPLGNTTYSTQETYEEEEELPTQLNHLWHIHKESNESACVREALCDIINQNTVDHVYTAMSRAPLILASVSNLLGVEGPGQMLDQITNTVISGEAYSCPSLPTCQF